MLGVGLITAAGISLAMLPDSEPAPAAAGEDVTAPSARVAVIDGATLKLRDRVVLLQGVMPPSRGTTCGGQDCGAAATNVLAALVRDAPLDCRVTGMDDFGRAVAICRAGSTELNYAVIAAGWARAGKARPDLRQAEEAARTAGLGAWASDGRW